MVETFYSTITEVPQLLEIINQHSQVERLRQTLRQHLLEMFSGQIDQAFIDKRKRVAQVHLKNRFISQMVYCRLSKFAKLHY